MGQRVAEVICTGADRRPDRAPLGQAVPVHRLLVIFNPAAGRRRQRLAAVLAALRARGCAIDVMETTAAGDAERWAAHADPARFDRLVVAGGDGTVNEVVNGLAGSSLPLAIVPLGTANVLAAETGLRTDPESVARAIVEGVPRPVSLGLVNGRRFLLMAGVGFDAHVVRDVTVPLKRRLGKGAYVWAVVRQLLAFGFPRYRVTIDGTKWQAASVVIANGRYYAGRFVCAPGGRLETPELEVCLFLRSGRRAVVLYALALFTGMLPKLRSYRVIPARRIEIAGPPGDPVQGDGDIVGHLDAEIEVLPAALELVFPPER